MAKKGVFVGVAATVKHGSRGFCGGRKDISVVWKRRRSRVYIHSTAVIMCIVLLSKVYQRTRRGEEKRAREVEKRTDSVRFRG